MMPARLLDHLMERGAASGILFRFGTFEVDTVRNTLTRSGARVKIQDQPFRLLLFLLERPGEVVSREELRQRLWPEGTYVDFDGSLNVILKRLRAALDDDPDNPRFIETLPRRGYRFIAPVSIVQRHTEPAPPGAPIPPALPSPGTRSFPVEDLSGRATVPRLGPRYLIFAVCAFCSVVLLIAAWTFRGKLVGRDGRTVATVSQYHVRKSVAVLGFKNLSGRSEDAWLATAVAEMLSTELSAGEHLRLISGEDIANLRISSPWMETDSLDRATTARIGNALNSNVLVLGSYTLIGTADRRELRVDVRMQDGKTGEILTEVAEVGSPQDLFRLVSQIGAKLRERLGVQPLQGTEEAGVLAASPLSPEAARLYAIGLTKLRQFDALSAKDLLEQAAAADPKFSLVHAMLARAWAELGYEQKHKEEAKKALDLSTDLPRAQRMLVEGEYYESLGKQEQAASVYRALFELFPDNLEFGLRLVAEQTLLGRGSQAMEVIRRLRNLPLPSSGDPRIDLAEAQAIKDNKPAALVLERSAMRKASERGQKLIYALARKEECMTLLYGSEPAQAYPSCEDAYNIFLAAGNRKAAADAIRLMADGLGTQGQVKKSIATYQRALDVLNGLGEHEKTGAVFNNMAINFANEGDLDRAEHLYREARIQFEEAGDPKNQATVVGNIADILYLRGNLAGAEKVYREALQITSSLETSQPGYILYRLADLNLTRGEVQEARRLAQQAIDSYLPTQGSYQYLTGAMIVLGEVMEAQGDLAGARSQFEQTLATRQKMDAPGLAAESQSELAGLAVEEGHPEQAEPLVRSALAEFEKEKSDPDSSAAYTLLSRVLLMEGKLEGARAAAQRGSQLSLTSSDPALRLPAEIQQARVDMAGPGNGMAGEPSPLRRLQSVIATAKRLGYYNLEHEAQLALGELQLKINSSVGHKQLKALASETRSHGFELLARQAENALSSSMGVAQVRSH
jgi:DNA-binding winged helix-turn-helix (wHTH) protein/ATP/maltotriose-dependent transcriptional regulator MalT/TolB-like protein